MLKDQWSIRRRGGVTDVNRLIFFGTFIRCPLSNRKGAQVDGGYSISAQPALGGPQLGSATHHSLVPANKSDDSRSSGLKCSLIFFSRIFTRPLKRCWMSGNIIRCIVIIDIFKNRIPVRLICFIIHVISFNTKYLIYWPYFRTHTPLPHVNRDVNRFGISLISSHVD